MQVNFEEYSPVNDDQDMFHKSNAAHRLLIGGVGAGKTFPAAHEAFFLGYENPGHNFGVFRNTWDSLTDHIEGEMEEIGDAANAFKSYSSSKHEMVLHNGLTILFRPLTLEERQLKGLNLCGFFVDDPDTKRHASTISFLFSRLRNKGRVKAKSFRTIFTANWEGQDWLYQTFMQKNGKEKKPGEYDMSLADPENPRLGRVDPFAYWLLPTDGNPTLPPDYIANLAATHSDEWMDRYVYMRNLKQYSGLVYPQFDARQNTGDLSFCHKKDNGMIKIMVVDVGLTVTCVLKMATDMKHVYVYDEWYRRGVKSSELGEYLRQEAAQDNYKKVIIDPSSARAEQTSGISVKRDLRQNWGIITTGANNNISYGIHLIRDLLKPANGTPLFFVDNSSRNTIKEMIGYKLEKYSGKEGDDVIYKDTPVKKNDHAMDCIRYGSAYLEKYIKRRVNILDETKRRRDDLFKERIEKLKMFTTNPDFARQHMRERRARQAQRMRRNMSKSKKPVLY